jgi:hypothetical protein
MISEVNCNHITKSKQPAFVDLLTAADNPYFGVEIQKSLSFLLSKNHTVKMVPLRLLM